MSWIKSFGINASLILVSIVVAVLLLEWIFHITPVMRTYRYPLDGLGGGYFKWDAQMGYDIVPNKATSTHEFSDLSYPAWSNELGCFDAPYRSEDPYIYLGGDSFAWGYTALEQKWGKVVERSTGVRTLTCGVPGFGTRQEVMKAKRIIEQLPKPPKLIVISHFEDDAADDAQFPNYTSFGGYVVHAFSNCDPKFMLTHSPLVATTTCNVPEPDYPPLQRIKAWLATHSALYLLAKRQLGIQDAVRNFLRPFASGWLVQNGLAREDDTRFNNRSLYFKDDTNWQVHFANLKALKTLADQHGSRLLVVLIPFKEMVTATTTDPTWANERTKAYLKQQGIAYLDLLPLLRATDPSGTLLYWYRDVHWTSAGDAVVGAAVSDYIQEQHLLP